MITEGLSGKTPIPFFDDNIIPHLKSVLTDSLIKLSSNYKEKENINEIQNCLYHVEYLELDIKRLSVIYKSFNEWRDKSLKRERIHSISGEKNNFNSDPRTMISNLIELEKVIHHLYIIRDSSFDAKIGSYLSVKNSSKDSNLPISEGILSLFPGYNSLQSSSNIENSYLKELNQIIATVGPPFQISSVIDVEELLSYLIIHRDQIDADSKSTYLEVPILKITLDRNYILDSIPFILTIFIHLLSMRYNHRREVLKIIRENTSKVFKILDFPMDLVYYNKSKYSKGESRISKVYKYLWEELWAKLYLLPIINIMAYIASGFVISNSHFNLIMLFIMSLLTLVMISDLRQIVKGNYK